MFLLETMKGFGYSGDGYHNIVNVFNVTERYTYE